MKSTLKDKEWGIVISVLATITFIIILFSQSTGLISQNYYQIFFYLSLGVVVLAWLIIFFIERSKKADQIFFFNQKTHFKFFNNFPVRILVGLILAFIFSISAFGLGSPIIDLPQPFNQEAFAVVSGTSSEIYFNLMFKAWIPGIFEELGIFLFVCLISYLIINGFNLKRPSQLIFAYLISSGIGSIILTIAHRLAYGSDVGAYIGIFLFETIVQFSNQLTGGFISWIPHFIHNGVVSLNFLMGFSIGGVALLLLPIWRKKK
ncbi:hypothetical protein K8R33_02900 [archaeon]|nr:hypothetical protein [archaeon]